MTVHVDWDDERGWGSHSNGGSEDFTTAVAYGWETPYSAISDQMIIDDNTEHITITVRDNDHNGFGDNPGHDGNDSIVFTIDDPAYSKGFAQEVYIFTEEEAKNNGGQIQKDIPLVAGSDIKAVTIIIEDNDDGDVFNLNPIEGGPGADTLDGTEIGDAIYGYAGDDILDGKAGRDSIYGFAGNDTLKGGEDNDVVYGNSGNDSLEGNRGNDTLDGGTGNDELNGGSGNDTLFGWYDNDTIIGGLGSDTLYGEDGNDYLYGDKKIDKNIGIFGGNDKLYGGNGDDTLKGGGGDDELYGEEGNDILIGQLGNDALTGGSGNDTLTGNLGSDSFIFNYKNEGIDTITDFDVSHDKIIIEKDTFGATDLDQFIYNSFTGALSFNENTSSRASLDSIGTGSQFKKFAIIENTPADFSIGSNIELV